MGKNVMKPDRVASPWYQIVDLVWLFDVTDRTIWKWVAAGKIPEPVRRGPRWTRWPKVQINRLMKTLGLEPPDDSWVPPSERQAKAGKPA